MTEAQHDLLATLRDLCGRLPVPDRSWHAHVALIAAARRDFERALAACSAQPAVLDLVAAAIEGDVDVAFDRDADAALTEAYDRFRRLPIPEGQHPFLDEILPALEAIEATLTCLGADRAAAAAFGRAEMHAVA